MAGINLTTAQKLLDAWVSLALKLAADPYASVDMEDGRAYTAKDLAAVQAQIEYWDRRVKELSALAAGASRAAVPNRYAASARKY